MFCGECGTQNPDANQFCRNCGAPLSRKPAAPSVSRPQEPHPSSVPAGASSIQPVIPASYPSAPAPVTSYQQSAAVQHPPAVSAPGKAKNWLGIASLIFGILSWFVLTSLFAGGAILLGIAGTVLFRKTTGRIGKSGILGIVFGFAAIAVTIALG